MSKRQQYRDCKQIIGKTEYDNLTRRRILLQGNVLYPGFICSRNSVKSIFSQWVTKEFGMMYKILMRKIRCFAQNEKERSKKIDILMTW